MAEGQEELSTTQTPAISADRIGELRERINEKVIAARKKSGTPEDIDSQKPRRQEVNQAGSTIRQEEMVKDIRNKLLEEQQKRETAEKQSYIDAKTELPNSKFFLQVIEAEIAEVNRYPEHRGNRLVIADIDDFGQFNRTNGELFGDKVLHTVAQTMQQSVRESDTVARWGGEEMVISMPVEITNGSNTTTQLDAVERVRDNIENTALVSPKTNEAVKLTTSIGTTTYQPNETFDAYFERADEAMGIAKLLGKNRVIEAGFDKQNNPIYTDIVNQHIYVAQFNADHSGTITDTTMNIVHNVILGENGKPKIA